MYNQTEAIFTQYDIEIQDITKGRGAVICDTNEGRILMVPFRGSKEKGMLLHQFLEGLEARDFVVEQIILNKNKEAVTEDEYTGERFLLKTYVEGTEIKTNKLEDMKEAVRILAIFHNLSEEIELEKKQILKPEGITDSWCRHYRELIKVRNYIRGSKKKTEFERIYMKHFEHNRKAAEDSLLLLEQAAKEDDRYVLCHGDFNQHNVLLSKGMYRIVHFEKIVFHWAMIDLANFIRKMLEKNEWNETIGKELILEYNRYRPIEKQEARLLYGLLLFPEKFWKVTNHYMNSRKSWISGRETDKLKKVIEQEELRLKFLENVVAFLR